MIKLNILDMKNFLKAVDDCAGRVHMLCPDGKRVNINRNRVVQNSLWERYRQNKNCLRLVLEISNPRDYMNIVSYYIGDC